MPCPASASRTLLDSGRWRRNGGATVVSEVFAADPGTACASGAVTGVCNGISGYPVKFDPNSPTGVSALCPPYNNPFIVFSPHPDDETLAMAGAIRAAKDANRQVIVE